MKKSIYESPCTMILQVRVRGRILQNSFNNTPASDVQTLGSDDIYGDGSGEDW